MARLGSNRGKNRTRATAIIQDMQKETEEQAPIVETPEVVEPTDNIETPVVEETLPSEPIAETEPTEVEAPLDSAPIVETPPVVEPVEVPQEPTVITDDLILSKLSETLGREIKSYDDLKTVEKAIDPEVKQLLEWKEKTGLSLTQFSDYNKDFSKMGDMEVAREILSQKYPTFTKEQLDFELSNLVYNEDMDDDRDKMRKSVELTKLATEGRRTLEANKLNLKSVESQGLTQEQTDAIAYANQQREAQQQATSNQEAYMNKLKDAALNLKGLNFKVGDTAIEHNIADDEKKSLSKFVSEMPHWYNEDGSANHSNIVSDGYKLKNFEALMNTAFEQGRAAATESKIKSDNNINLDTPVAPQGVSEEKKGNIGNVVSNLTGKNKKSNFRFRNRKN